MALFSGIMKIWTRNSMVGLKTTTTTTTTTIQRVTYAKISPKMANPRDRAGR